MLSFKQFLDTLCKSIASLFIVSKTYSSSISCISFFVSFPLQNHKHPPSHLLLLPALLEGSSSFPAGPWCSRASDSLLNSFILSSHVLWDFFQWPSSGDNGRTDVVHQGLTDGPAAFGDFQVEENWNSREGVWFFFSPLWFKRPQTTPPSAAWPVSWGAASVPADSGLEPPCS